MILYSCAISTMLATVAHASSECWNDGWREATRNGFSNAGLLPRDLEYTCPKYGESEDYYYHEDDDDDDSKNLIFVDFSFKNENDTDIAEKAEKALKREEEKDNISFRNVMKVKCIDIEPDAQPNRDDGSDKEHEIWCTFS